MMRSYYVFFVKAFAIVLFAGLISVFAGLNKEKADTIRGLRAQLKSASAMLAADAPAGDISHAGVPDDPHKAATEAVSLQEVSYGDDQEFRYVIVGISGSDTSPRYIVFKVKVALATNFLKDAMERSAGL